MLDSNSLLSQVVNIAYEAGQLIMQLYNVRSQIQYKDDNSPLTQADTTSNDLIVSKLKQLTPNVAVISEENLSNGLNNPYSNDEQVWLVDPLDGTKDFLDHNDEFTVNIALIKNHRPILGVVYAPALDLMYFASVEEGAYKRQGDDQPAKIEVAKQPHNPLIALVSRFHLDEATQTWLDKLGDHKTLPVGSSLKFCYLADGTGDIYPRLASFNEWDIAAADAILRIAGGSIIQEKDQKLPIYNKESLQQPPFIAYGTKNINF